MASLSLAVEYLKREGLRAQMVVFGLGTALFLSLVMAMDLPVNTISLRVGDIADQTVRAQRDGYFNNRVATDERRREAEALVPPVYDVSPGAAEAAQSSILATFEKLKTVAATLSQSDNPDLLGRVRSNLPVRLSDKSILAAIGASSEVLDQAKAEALRVVRKVYNQGIRSNTNDIQIAHETIRRTIAASRLPLQIRDLTTEVSWKVVFAPNYLYNERETDRRRWEKSAQVEPVRSRIEVGETIIQAGQTVTLTEIDKLVALGLQSPRLDPQRAASLFLLSIFFVTILGLFMRQYAPHIYEQDRLIGLLSLMVCLALVSFKIVNRFHGLEYVAVPITVTTSMVIAIMLDARFAVMVAVMVGVMTATMSNNEFSLCVMSLAGSFVGIYCVSDLHSRAQLTRTALVLGGANLILSAAVGALTGHVTPDILGEISWGLGSGIACVVLTLGLVMFLERPFGVTTHLRLLELSDPNEAILKRLQMEAPGTCTHSIMVANLAESAAKAIEADALLTRVASYYHDIGKVKRPYCFTENQFAAENIHDKLTPTLSTLAIIAHVKEGIEMAKELKLPQAIIDIIPQHHGTSLVLYFYNRALENQSGGEVPETGFRYPGPKPQTREAAIIMLADGVEAAARSLSGPTPARIEAMIRRIMKDRLDDGQLSECNLTLKELETIAKTFAHMLQGLIHTRVEYPDQDRDMPAIPLEAGKARRKGEISDARIGAHTRSEKGVGKEASDSKGHLRRISGRRH